MKEVQKPFAEFITISPGMEKIFKILEKASQTDANILLLGETGTGKELLAHAIHDNSPRRYCQIIALNCSAIPDTLLESELFGYEKGAFTDARRDKMGKMEMADKGTLFLDEIGDMSLPAQSKMLRVLETKHIEKIGGTKTISVNVRIIAATNQNLERAIQEITFRKDLFYRLAEVVVRIPPLRERPEDIPCLVEHFIKLYNVQYKKSVKNISDTALNFLMNHNFPGNVRELRNLIKRAIITMDTETIWVEHLPLDIRIRTEEIQCDMETTTDVWTKENHSFRNNERDIPTLKEIERDHIKRVLESVGMNKSKAAKLLGIDRTTFYKKIREYKIST